MNRQVKWLGQAPPVQRVQWLGAVPSACWSVTGFKPCVDASFKAAQTTCYAQKAYAEANPGSPQALIWQSQFGGNFGNCTSYYNEPGVNACVAKFCNKDQPATNYPWGVYSAQTKTLQDQLNQKLSTPNLPDAPYGYMPINADGKVGPATCGAAQAVWPEMEPTSCAGHSITKPTPKPAPGGGGGPVVPTAECSDTKPCPAGQACVNGKCEPTAPPTSSTKSSGSGLGLLLLGGAAAAGVLFLGPAIFGKGGIDKAMSGADRARAARLLENRRRRRKGY